MCHFRDQPHSKIIITYTWCIYQNQSCKYVVIKKIETSNISVIYHIHVQMLLLIYY